jgi:hypothetical protein
MNEPNQDKTPEELQTDASIAEAKRLAARRRFLGRGTAAASGLVIVTLCHQRAFAKKPAPAPWVPPTTQPQTPTVPLGSAALCQSLGGGNQVYTVTDSMGHSKGQVQCQDTL